ncbi:MAG: hypothetical protein M1821_003863 [Bathelium mastoideum]|nr:MAG: hypothetical protein M1821_003863 [Bathelium mastoideum]KAI9690939.1 MAG: hypothetical protein M1822_008559 [Bathelium mastoideum]
MAQADQKLSEPRYAQSDKKKTDYPWWVEDIDKHLVPQTRKLLEEYSGIPPAQQPEHVHQIRDQAWAIRSYPCSGMGVWLQPYILQSPAYASIIDRLKSGATFLDIGCFIAQDMRQLAFGGAPTSNMHGVDIVSHWDVGFAMYRDQGRFKAHFIETDMFSRDNATLNQLLGRADVISISALLHQWAWDGQLAAAKRSVEFSSPKPGTLVVGHQIGNVQSGEITMKAGTRPSWRHDPTSFARLWEHAGAETNTEWKTEARLLTWEDIGWDAKDHAWMFEGDRVLDFVVTRLK